MNQHVHCNLWVKDYDRIVGISTLRDKKQSSSKTSSGKMLLNLLFWHFHQDFLPRFNRPQLILCGNGNNKDEHKLPQITIHFSSDNKNTDMNLCQTQTLLKVLSVNDPYGGVLFGHHRGSTWHQVQQGQLTKAATRCNCLHQFPSLLLQKTRENLGWNWNCLIFKWDIAQINTKKNVLNCFMAKAIPIIKIFVYVY